MSEDKKPQKPFSITEAGNYLKEKNKTLADEIHKETEKQQISTALPQDRIAYLMHALSYLDDVSPEVYRAFMRISGTISSSLTRTDVAALLQRILLARTYGFGISYIANAIKEPIERVAQLEELGMIACSEQLHKKGMAGVPVFSKN
jgi:hypothetical protein